jgi:hypothetical protein
VCLDGVCGCAGVCGGFVPTWVMSVCLCPCVAAPACTSGTTSCPFD